MSCLPGMTCLTNIVSGFRFHDEPVLPILGAEDRSIASYTVYEECRVHDVQYTSPCSKKACSKKTKAVISFFFFIFNFVMLVTNQHKLLQKIK